MDPARRLCCALARCCWFVARPDAQLLLSITGVDAWVRSPEAECLRLKVVSCHAGHEAVSRFGGVLFGGCLHRSNISMIIMRPPQHGHDGRKSSGSSGGIVIRWRGDVQQFASEREASVAGGAGEQAVVPNAVEATRQNMDEEAADELVGCERHYLLTVGAVAAKVLVAEGDAV